eukprot:TRINITY_DN2339_c0_g3_i2.p1 TRINITY_DN2339_c0_g3~~TRINITY_DN2339_c0_g3_i2.p1  ORF type:complete len:546 (-),score=82.30 TRINITY_DN2339_c0_g3_i2:154-1791(-)
MQSITSLIHKLRGKSEFRIVLGGIDYCGKTTILYKLKLGEIVATMPTIGFNVETIDYKRTELTCWDVGGGCGGTRYLKTLYRHYLNNTQAIIYVVDANDVDHDRLLEAKEFFEDVFLKSEDLVGVPFLFLLNKCDLPNAMLTSKFIDSFGLHSLRGHKWYVQRTVATTGEGLYEGLEWLYLILKETKPNPPKPVEEKVEPEKQVEKSEKKVEKKSEKTEKDETSDSDKFLEWVVEDNDTEEQFLEDFKNLKIRKFDHRVLLRACWVYLKHFGRQKTVKEIFEVLRPYYNDPTQYNQTLIYFWLQMVNYSFSLTPNPDNKFVTFLLLNPALLAEKEFPLEYFNEKLLFSEEARLGVVLPDKKKMPNLIPKSNNNNNNVKDNAGESSGEPKLEKLTISSPPSTSASGESSTTSVTEIDENQLSDDEFLHKFSDYTLQSWDHKAHLRIGWLYLTKYGRREGSKKIFTGIENFIAKSPIPRKTTFHFTMTYFWVQMVDLAIASTKKDHGRRPCPKRQDCLRSRPCSKKSTLSAQVVLDQNSCPCGEIAS